MRLAVKLVNLRMFVKPVWTNMYSSKLAVAVVNVDLIVYNVKYN